MAAITHVAAANPQTAIGLVVPLKPGREEAHRAAVSGVFSEAARDALEKNGVVNLGTKVSLAAAYKVVEEAMWGVNTMIARCVCVQAGREEGADGSETYMLARKNGIDLNLLFHALAGGAAGSQCVPGRAKEEDGGRGDIWEW